MAEYAFEQDDRDLEDAAHHQHELEHQMAEFETIDGITKALAEAQLEMTNPKFDSQNPHFRNNFASLASVRNAVVPVLAKHGIAMTQNLETTEGGIACTTTLWHSSGQFLRFGPLVMPATKADAQGYGSAATYARRYALMAVCGVVGDDDDDANAASGKVTTDPRGDLGKQVDTKTVNKWAKALIEQIDQPHRIVEIWDEVKSDHDLAVAVWAALPKSVRDRVKDARDAA